MNKRQAEAFASSLLKEWGLSDWKFAVDGSQKNICGRCYWGPKLITVTHWHLELGPEEAVKDTIRHEVAHALTPNDHDHGPEWQAMAKRVGADPKAKKSEGSIHSLGPRYTARCCTTSYHRERSIPKNKRAICPKCQSPLTFVLNQPTIRTPKGEYIPRFAANEAGPVTLGVTDVEAMRKQLKAATTQREKRQLRSLLRKLGHRGGLKHEVKK